MTIVRIIGLAKSRETGGFLSVAYSMNFNMTDQPLRGLSLAELHSTVSVL